MLFINTRPQERSQALSLALLQAGHQVLELPLLELTPTAYSLQLQQLYQNLPFCQVIVVVSPAAADVGMQYLQQSGISLNDLRQLQWIAVGQTTAEHLKHYGISSQVPKLETSEGMLELNVFRQFNDLHSVAFWRGEGGRQFMMQNLHQQGIKVLNFILYERSCPTQSIHDFSKVAAQIIQYGNQVLVPITSEASWSNWLDLCQNQQSVLQLCHYLVLGERLYQLIHGYKIQHQAKFQVSKIEYLKPEVILQYIAELQGKL